MTISQCYEKLGGDFEGVMSRLMKAERVAKFTLRYPDDPTYGQLVSSLDAKDYETAFRAAHTMKGTSANLGFTALYGKVCIITEELRGGHPEVSRLPAMLADVSEEYSRTVEIIKEYSANKED